jgi:hypothetical protein
MNRRMVLCKPLSATNPSRVGTVCGTPCKNATHRCGPCDFAMLSKLGARLFVVCAMNDFFSSRVRWAYSVSAACSVVASGSPHPRSAWHPSASS